MYFFCICYKFFMLISREAVGSTDEISDLSKVLSNLSLNNTNAPKKGFSECVLHINKDLPKRNDFQPLYLIPDTNKFWLPNEKGELSIPRNDEIELYCSDAFDITTNEYDNYNNNTEITNSNNNCTDYNNKNNTAFNNNERPKIMLNISTLRLRCINGTTFLWQNESHKLSHFLCTQRVRYTIEPTNVSCVDLHLSSPKPSDYVTNGTAAQIYRVGYRLNTPSNRFIETMSICYDETLLVAHYVQHDLVPGNVHYQKMVKRTNFGKIGHFKQWNMNYLYSKRNQYEQAKKLLNGQYEHLFNSSKGLYLTRGHLAAKADFVYATQQRTTFIFFNIAPQWQTFNGGQWSVLENEVRKFIAKSNLNISCYTGTWGVLHLPINTTSSESREFYLTVDENNNGILPVPRLYYRILIDNSSNINNRKERGIALIGVNNPHANMNEIHDSYIICSDIHEQIKWLYWIKNDNLKKGYLYACLVSEFANIVEHLPKSLMNVNELLQ